MQASLGVGGKCTRVEWMLEPQAAKGSAAGAEALLEEDGEEAVDGASLRIGGGRSARRPGMVMR